MNCLVEYQSFGKCHLSTGSGAFISYSIVIFYCVKFLSVATGQTNTYS